MNCGGKVIIDDDCTMITEFMVLFKSSDFISTSILGSKVEKTKKLSTKLPGNLIVYNIKDINNNNIKIKGVPVLHTLYVKLPKENIIVTSNMWENDYFNSQILETIHIWTCLGVKQIKFESKRSAENSKSSSGKIGLGSCFSGADLGGKFENENDEKGTITGKLILNEPHVPNYESLKDFIDSNGIYYMKNSPKWLHLITYKLKYKSLSHVDFEYEFTRDIHCDSNVTSKFNNMGITFKTSDDFTRTIHIKYNIEFDIDHHDLDK